MSDGKYELTEEWLERIDEEFGKNDVPHKQRPLLAWREWQKYTGVPMTLGDEVATKIFT